MNKLKPTGIFVIAMLLTISLFTVVGIVSSAWYLVDRFDASHGRVLTIDWSKEPHAHDMVFEEWNGSSTAPSTGSTYLYIDNVPRHNSWDETDASPSEEFYARPWPHKYIVSAGDGCRLTMTGTSTLDTCDKPTSI